MTARDDPRRPSELVNAREAAGICGVVPSAVSNYRARTLDPRRAPFPEPWLEQPRTVLYVRAEIEEWAVAEYARDAESRAARIAALERQLQSLRHTAAPDAGPNPASRKERGC